MRCIFLAALALSSFLGLLSAGPAFATFYGDFVSATGHVAYRNVRDEQGLLGTAFASADSLDFSPGAMIVHCSACPSGISKQEVLSLEIEALGDQRIEIIQLGESLGYSLQSRDPDGFAAAAGIATVQIEILELDGEPVSGLTTVLALEFSPLSTPVALSTGSAQGIIQGTSGWIDVLGLIQLSGRSGRATRIGLILEHDLRAFAEGEGASSRLQLGDAEITSWTSGPYVPIPEPSTAVLVLLGLTSLARRPFRSSIDRRPE